MTALTMTILATNGQPVKDASLTFKVKGKDGNEKTVTGTTDTNGKVSLQGIDENSQIAAVTNGTTGQWTTAKNGSTLKIASGSSQQQQQRSTTFAGASAGNNQGGKSGNNNQGGNQHGSNKPRKS